MARKKYSTSFKFSPEFVRRSQHGGLELVQTTGSHETITPVQVTTKGSTRRWLVIGYEPIFVNGELRVF